MTKKQIFASNGHDRNRTYGPDVINFPEFCAVNRWIYDTRGQVDMGPAIDNAIMRAFEEKKFLEMGDLGLRTDGEWPSPIIEAMQRWIHIHLNPFREYWDQCRDEIPVLSERLKAKGFDTNGWDDLI